MLELDLFLSRFVENSTGYQQLKSKELQQFYDLLEFPDQELYEVLIGKTQPVQKELNTIVSKIQQCSSL